MENLIHRIIASGLVAVGVEGFGPEGSARAAEVPAEEGAAPADALMPRTRIVGRVIPGSFHDDDGIAVKMALDDVRTYWGKAFGAGSFLLDGRSRFPSRASRTISLPQNAPALPRDTHAR